MVTVGGGFSSYSPPERQCECQCRQHRTENVTELPTGWYTLNGEKYEDVVIGDAYGLKECLKFCTTMMAGNLFRACMPIKEE